MALASWLFITSLANANLALDAALDLDFRLCCCCCSILHDYAPANGN